MERSERQEAWKMRPASLGRKTRERPVVIVEDDESSNFELRSDSFPKPFFGIELNYCNLRDALQSHDHIPDSTRLRPGHFHFPASPGAACQPGTLILFRGPWVL